MENNTQLTVERNAIDYGVRRLIARRVAMDVQNIASMLERNNIDSNFIFNSNTTIEQIKEWQKENRIEFRIWAHKGEFRILSTEYDKIFMETINMDLIIPEVDDFILMVNSKEIDKVKLLTNIYMRTFYLEGDKK